MNKKSVCAVLAAGLVIGGGAARADEKVLPPVWFGTWRGDFLLLHPGPSAFAARDLGFFDAGPIAQFVAEGVYAAPLRHGVVPEPVNGLAVGTAVAVFDADGARCEAKVTAWILAEPYDLWHGEPERADLSLFARVDGCVHPDSPSWTRDVFAVRPEDAARVGTHVAPGAVEPGVAKRLDDELARRTAALPPALPGGRVAERTVFRLPGGLVVASLVTGLDGDDDERMRHVSVVALRPGARRGMSALLDADVSLCCRAGVPELLGITDLDGDGRPELLRRDGGLFQLLADDGGGAGYTPVVETVVRDDGADC